MTLVEGAGSDVVHQRMSQKEFANHLGCDLKVINRIVNGRSAVTAEMALKLGSALRTTPEFSIGPSAVS